MIFEHLPRTNISQFVVDHAEALSQYPVVLISCLDSDPQVSSSSRLEQEKYQAVGRCVALRGADLLKEIEGRSTFFGFDEVWFGSAIPETEIPFPAIVAPCEQEEFLPVGFATWFDNSPLAVGLGDGFGLTILLRDEAAGSLGIAT